MESNDDADNDGVLVHDQLFAADVATQVLIDLNVAIAPQIASEPHRTVEHGPGGQLGIVQVRGSPGTVRSVTNVAVVARIESHLKPVRLAPQSTNARPDVRFQCQLDSQPTPMDQVPYIRPIGFVPGSWLPPLHVSSRRDTEPANLAAVTGATANFLPSPTASRAANRVTAANGKPRSVKGVHHRPSIVIGFAPVRLRCRLASDWLPPGPGSRITWSAPTVTVRVYMRTGWNSHD